MTLAHLVGNQRARKYPRGREAYKRYAEPSIALLLTPADLEQVVKLIDGQRNEQGKVPRALAKVAMRVRKLWGESMVSEEAVTAAHVDGHRAGTSGRPCIVPAYGSDELREAWLRGYRIGLGRAAPKEGAS